jgi:hypothetical protein
MLARTSNYAIAQMLAFAVVAALAKAAKVRPQLSGGGTKIKYTDSLMMPNA